MNATCWTSLTALCKYLGKEGKCVVDETEKGWFIQYIDKDPKLLAKQAAMDQQQKADINEEERMRRMIAAQVAAAAGTEGEGEEEEKEGARDLIRADSDAKLEIKMTSFVKAAGPLRPGAKTAKPVSFQANVFAPAPSSSSSTASASSSSSSSKKSISNIDALMAEAEKKKASQEDQEDHNNRLDYWLTDGIMVKVMNKKIGEGKFYKCKGVVEKVIDHYVGEVRLDECGTKIRLDQEDLETVLPKVGRRGVLLNGRCRGQEVEVVQIHVKAFNCDVRVVGGSSSSSMRDKELKGVDYEDISKLA